MRVAAGTARGRRLEAPPGRRIRPTSDRVRHALMDILAPWTAGARWLDLFAGSGAVGIEALSRGACKVVFVERDPAACRTVQRNVEATGLSERAEVVRQDVKEALHTLVESGQVFDVIFADPPYELSGESLSELGPLLARLLRPGGVAALEHSTRRAPALWPGLRRVREATYGETRISFYVHEAERSPWL